MNLENINFRAKDVIQFCVYIISLTVLFLSLSSKVDNLTHAVEELKSEKKESSGDHKISNTLIQNDIKALTIRAELNRQNDEQMKADIEMIKIQYHNQNNN